MNAERILADRKFVADLNGSRVGRILQAHITSVSKYEEGRACESSAQEVTANERVLITAISRSLLHDRAMPCGLPFPLPKFIAICNLSGEQLVLHGSSPSILRKLCTRSSILSPREVAQQMLAFEAFPEFHTSGVSKFVLLSYSLPWQAGVGSAFWSVSCCDYRTDTREVRDRMLTFSSTTNSAFHGKSVLDPTDASVLIMNNNSMPMVTAKNMKDLNDAFCCCGFDVADDEETVGGGSSGGASRAPNKQAALEELVRGLQQGRTKDHAEISKLKAQSTTDQGEMIKLVEQCELRINKLKQDQDVATTTQEARFDEARGKAKELLGLKESQRSALNAEFNALKASYEEKVAEQTESTKALKKLRAKMEEQRRQSTAKDNLGNAAASKHKMTIKMLEDKLEAAKTELVTARQDLEGKHKRTMEAKVTSHAKEVDRFKASIEGKERIVNQLSEVSERREAEIRSLQAVDLLRGAEIEKKAQEIETIKADLEVAQKVLATPKTRTVGVSTRTSSTSTHSCATTQTPPPRPATPPPPPTKTAAEKDVDATHSTTAATTTSDCDAIVVDSRDASNQEPVSALCQKAQVAVQNLIAHVCALEGQATSPIIIPVSPQPQCAMPLPTFQPQFLHPNHQMVYAHHLPQQQLGPQPQYFHPQPQYAHPANTNGGGGRPHHTHKPHGSARLYRGQ